MNKKYRPLKNFTRRLPTATFGNYKRKGRHTKMFRVFPSIDELIRVELRWDSGADAFRAQP